MSGAEQWAQTLSREQENTFTLQFQRLGLEAQCRPLTAGEVEECIRMGGERGLRYALYLACEDLRAAGESLRRQGTLELAFDITERICYGDVMAAGAAILSKSGAHRTEVRLAGGGETTAPGLLAEDILPSGADTIFQNEAEGLFPPEAHTFLWEDASGVSGKVADAGSIAREFADRLWAAAGNR